jgi:protoporphyrinogen oxidase
VDKSYHHIFANDDEILDFAKEIGFDGFFFKEPETASLVDMKPRLQQAKNYRIFPVDNPQDFLKLPYLSLFEKLRAGVVIAFLKISPYFSIYEKYTAENFLRKTMGEAVWKKLWEELFRKKFGKYAGIILASFIWSRIKKRTKRLGYIRGGFQEFVNYLEVKNKEQEVIIEKNILIQSVQKNSKGFIINSKQFDTVISTLPTPITVEVGKGIFPSFYIKQLRNIKYLHALNLILETKEPILEKTYWLNVCVRELPMMIIAQHTNFIDKKYYGGNHIAYVGNYVEVEDKMWKMEDRELMDYYLSYLKKSAIPASTAKRGERNPQSVIQNYFVFRSKYAQPIFDKVFLKNKPSFETPVKNFYIANLDMTYPYDRETTYAVKLGKEVVKLILK